MTTIQSILEARGPMISSDLARIVSQLEGIPVNTASQRIARDKSLVRVSGFFQSGQSLIFLPEHQQDGDVFKILSEQMSLHGRKYWYALNAIRYNGGTISRHFLEAYSSYPIEPLKSHKPFNEVMQTFVKQDVLVFDRDEYSFSPKLRFSGANKFLSQTLEVIKHTVLENFKTQARNIGLISYDTGELFAEYGKFRWGLKGVCPIIGLRNGEHHGFLLADIILGRPTYKQDVEFFLTKLDQIQSFKNASRIMPYLLVDNLHNSALLALKAKGIVVGFIGELFGGKYAKLLNDLITLLTNAAAGLATNPEKYLELIIELKKYNQGLLNNIKGALFEYVVGHYHIFKGSKIDIGWEIYENDAKHEMDILATYSDKVVIAECKGRRSAVDFEIVDKWITKKIPAFKKWFQKQELYKNKDLEFEFWSSAGFTSTGWERAEQFAASYTKHRVIFLGPNEIKAKTKEMKNKKLQESLDNFFLKSNV
ncbi:hypothetical protein DBR43_09530 [Pedobacter sp. KBW06]|uniref:hypothetical protein n=1 Tax=Pedobacter sp. KBW06 TaxID=2153359 RepID=UPI000F5A87B4|nr:hypothetical protein [Pedobacter sp. KBW06]RQO75568.1 hypothetical protein DBR43_09530 [Pedobacter sp. KBW06]